MLFSIAIPTYNNEKTIAKAINSALDQTYKDDYEVVVVNNASSDNTAEILSSFFDSRIRIVTNTQTVEMYPNHNICLQNARGSYVLFCHSDDQLLPGALSIIEKKLQEKCYPEKYILWGRSLFRDFSIGTGFPINQTLSGDSVLPFLFRGGLTPSGTCYSRSSLLEVGGFPTASGPIPECDWILMLLCALNAFEFEMTDRLLFIRESGSTATNSIPAHVWLESDKAVFSYLEKALNPAQFRKIISYSYSFSSIDKYPLFKQYYSKKECITKLMHFFLAKPTPARLRYILKLVSEKP